MAYASVSAFVALVGDAEARTLAPPSPPGPGYDPAPIENALEGASAVQDSYLLTRHSVPLPVVPKVVEIHCLALAREMLDRSGRQTVKDAADRARAWHRDEARGLATLGVNPGSPEAPPASADDAGILIDAPARVFTDESLAAFLGRG